ENRRSLYFAANVNGVGGNHGHTVIGTLPAWLENATQSNQAAATQTAAATPPTAPRPLPAGDGGMVALISGQGAQYSGMMKPLYDAVPEIRGVLDGGERIFREMRGYSLLDVMFGESRQLNLTENTQPAVFLSSAALFGYLEARGLAPDVFIGHSVGEYGALFCAGLLDFETAMRLIVKRADFMKAATEEQPGRIMVVFKDAEAVHELIRASKVRNIYVANKNSVKQTGVSGAAADIDRFCDYLKDAKVMFKKLALSGAFHTPLFNRAAEQMATYLEEVTFNPANFGRVISNVTADPYPDDAAAVKKLLVRQIVSPVEFIASVTHARQAGYDRFYEIGPGRILVNLLKNIPIEDFTAQPTIDAKQGEVESLEKMVARLQADDRNEAPAAESAPAKPRASAPESLPAAPAPADEPLAAGSDFEEFMARNEKALREMAFREFQKQKREQALRDVERFNFYTGKAVVAGVAIGLPGSGNKVFNANNFEKLLNGNNFIEPLSPDEKKKIVDMNITRVFKQPDGNARFLDITDTRDVIQLAGKLGYFNLKNEYGVDYDYDVTIALAIAAGIEALKDAHIPMVLQHKETSTGNRIPNGYALPAEMQETTGVIMTSLFPGFETLIEQLNKYYYNKFYVRPYKELENIYYHLMESVRDPEIKEQITDWFFKIKERRKKYGTYKFERNLLFDVVPLGSAHFAQLIKAKGPNMMMSGACASTTQAVGVAEDWIRTGRCDRVIIVGGEASTSETQSPWIASGFLALGAASIKEVVTDAAKPFDAERNGTILGAGAVSLIIEREDRTRERGLNGQAEILGTYIGNSAFHATQIDQKHLTAEMARFVRRVESHHQIDPAEYTRSMVFMSHETFTPARGGSASAEVGSLKQTYPEHYRNITITNTKGFTGHTLGAAIEDAVMIKALQEGRVPPIANLSRVPDEFGDLNFSCGENGCGYEYGLHYAAGFGSHFAFLMVKRIAESQAEDNPVYRNWLRRISGLKRPQLKVIDNTLCIDPHVISEVEAPPAVTVDAPAAPPADAPPTQSEVPAVKPSAPPAADLLTMVKTIIAEQTGYTADMLEDELDLEADLGIDTVKQVEIFGKVSAHFGLDVPEDLRLNDLNTIAKIGDYLAARVSEAPSEAAPAPPVAETEARSVEKDEAEGPVKRLVVRAVPSDAPTGQPGWFKDRRVLMTADRHGFAALMAARITADGGTPVIVGDTEAAELTCDWSTPAAVKTLVKEIEGQYLPIDGIVHLTPLDGAFEPTPMVPAVIDRRLKQFFTLVQGLFEQLARPETFVAMPAFNGAVLPYGESAGPIDAVAAGLAGMLKTINKELPDTLVKVVDFDAAMMAEPEAMVDTFLAELTGGDRRVECGYRGGQRWGLQLALDGPETSGSLVVADDTVMVTGGARGITFEILKSLVAAHPVRLEILGRSDVDGLEPALADAAVSEADLMARLKADMQGAKPLEIKKALDRVVKLRESAANLNTLRSMGARVTYHAVDVSDAGAVERVVRSVGDVDVLIHAAGIEESQMIPKKTRASFDRVFDTKVAGLMNILAALDQQAPRSLMTFSSVTARFGNEGQVDYTAANDMIAKMLLEYGRQHPKTTVKIFDWTAWEGAGMATNETVNKVLRERGLTFLPLTHGVSLFMRELGDAKTPEVVFSGLDHAFDPDGLMHADQADAHTAPFLDACVEADDRRRVFSRVLDLERDLFLHDHAREDVPIFLGATGIEAMAEAAATLAAPGMHLRALRDFSIPYGIKILKQRPKEILIEAAATAEDADTFLCRITSQFRNKQGIAMGEPKLHYQGTYAFGPAEAAPPSVTLPTFQPVGYEGDIQELLYHPSRLFMDGLFRTVEEIVSFEEDRLISRIRSASTRPFFADDPWPSFLTDVAVVDAMFQTGGMLEVMTTNIIVLPYTIGRMRFHQP
ncbi:MAG: SDR family NAD(P)-dependent oxidoreductase, partial [Desulfobacterales bacterium]|nr:SDR family NAD(P)-dependent oxidoreductase [Desulfobacterales bacterium]